MGNKTMEYGPTIEELAEIEAELEQDTAWKFDEEDSVGNIDMENPDVGDIDTLHLYMREMGQIPLLTADEEMELGIKIKEGRENKNKKSEAEDARNKLITANLRLVLSCAKRICTETKYPLEDLNSYGIEGLIKAAEKFDYSLGYRFSTYATWWINQAISRGIYNEGRTIRIPVHTNELLRKVKKTRQELSKASGSEPSIEEIAVHSGLSEDVIISVLQLEYDVASLDTKVGEDEDSELGAMLEDTKSPDPLQEAIKKDRERVVKKVIAKLPSREAMIIMMRFGIGMDRPHTLEEISGMPQFGLSRERIRQLEEKAIRHIKKSPSMKRELEEFVVF